LLLPLLLLPVLLLPSAAQLLLGQMIIGSPQSCTVKVSVGEIDVSQS